jgi:hypothetical protein
MHCDELPFKEIDFPDCDAYSSQKPFSENSILI